MKRNNLLTMAASIAFAGFTHQAQAVGTTFFGEDLGLGEGAPLAAWPNADAAEASFLANLVGVGTEDFESFADGTGTPLNISFPGAGTAEINGSGAIESIAAGSTNGFGRYGTSPTNFWEVGTGSNDFSISFDSPVAAFGFHGIDIGDFSGQVQIDFVNGGTETFDIGHTVGAPGGSVLYFGYIDESNPFDSVSFTNTGSGADVFAFDDMTIGSVEQVQRVPENGSSLAFLLAGMVGLVGMARNTRPQTQA